MNQDMKSRPGNERPTRERIARGRYTLVPAEDAGVRYALDQASDPLARLYEARQIETWHWDAAVAYEDLARRIRGDVGQRSCINFDPVGHDGGEGDPIAEGSFKVIRQQLFMAGGFPVVQAVDAAAYFRDEVTDLRLLRAGLDVCVEYFGIRVDAPAK